MLIGLCGKAGAGKDTAADMLVEVGFVKLAIAQGLKDMLAVIGILEPARKDKEKILPGYRFSYRKAAQTLGSDWAHSIDPDLWVKLVRARLDTLKARGIGKVVISDVRFTNEVRMIQGLGGRIIEIQGRATDLGALSKHVSERGVSEKDIDLVIDNSGTFTDLKSKLYGVL